MFYTFVLTLVVIFNPIECSSQSDGNPDNNREAGPSPTQGTLSRTRSRSPASRLPPIEILGYSLPELGHMRLIPRTNQNLTFEFRRYLFPVGIPLRLRVNGKYRSPTPAQEYIVLSTPNGDIFAILADGGSLSGIYQPRAHHPRAKMNMRNSIIDHLSSAEIRDCPVGSNHPMFPYNFIKAFSNFDSLQFKWNSNRKPDSGSSSARHHSPEQSSTSEEYLIRARSLSPPGRPPTDKVLGYTIEQLGYLRLIPCKNQNQRFEFRRYVFPINRAIRMRIDHVNHLFGPTQEYIVLSTSTGDVFAILDYSGILRGIYRTGETHARVKINMISGAITNMTPDEMQDCKVGNNYPISPNRFIKIFSDHNSLQFEWNPDGERTPHTSISPLNRASLQKYPLNPNIELSSDPPSGRQLVHKRTFQEVSPLDARPRSPPGRPPTHEVFGYPLAELGYIRLIPKSNSERQFEFRKYIFPAAGGIQVLLGDGKFVPVPIREHIVLSSSNGEVFAILEYTGILRGIYRTNRTINWNYSRIKMNMITGEVDFMSESEMKECHVGKSYPIFPRWFNKVFSNEDSLQHLYQ